MSIPDKRCQAGKPVRTRRGNMQLRPIRPWMSERQIGEAGGGIVVNGGHARAQASIRPAGNGSHTASARTFAKSEARRGLTSAGKQAVSDAFEAQQVA